jgi:hypothetical protein
VVLPSLLQERQEKSDHVFVMVEGGDKIFFIDKKNGIFVTVAGKQWKSRNHLTDEPTGAQSNESSRDENSPRLLIGLEVCFALFLVTCVAMRLEQHRPPFSFVHVRSAGLKASVSTTVALDDSFRLARCTD